MKTRKKKVTVPPTLFSLLTVLTAEQRQKFGKLRRQLKEDAKVIEELLEDAEKKEWYLKYQKGKKEIAQIRFGNQKFSHIKLP